MSNRTILELNHDFAERIRKSPLEFAEHVLAYLNSASHEEAERLRLHYGARPLATVHHTDSVSISFVHKP